MRTRFLGLFVLAISLLAGCGGGGELSKSEYRSELVKVATEENDAQAAVAQGLNAKTVGELRSHLIAFAAASQRIGDELAALKPPQDAESANAELARGEHDTAKATRAAAAAIATQPDAKRALALLQTKLGNAKGGQEIDDALKKLRKLHYTKGS